ncbi:GMC family oxidoreductase [Defluviimonas sp. WL0050]|uniref:GMC family oxidoreductase n=1 Tax=Albidovulum litorale TaxID=2984134 RepID=A0ABT2ZHR6_9RHOB|nr:GMC family oxidoreductase [Defluviimonas sp. WL0050]MCV2870674.1 GMC family oxidoreductase [Defluviimonas sp. WL0050]
MVQPLEDDRQYDVVIVGAGIAGAILAKQLLAKGRTVLMLEAGADHGQDWQTYREYLDKFYLSLAKTPNSPYPNLPTVPSPEVLDITPVRGTVPDTNGYFVQRGPMPFGSNYLRAYGGTTLHWLGTSLRMLPADFEMASRFGKGVDWPVGYTELRPYYEKAEWEIGVSAEAAEQTPQALGIRTSAASDNKAYFAKGYDYPMHALPTSYCDQYFEKRMQGLSISTSGQRDPGGVPEQDADIVEPKVANTPQGRNSIPRVFAKGAKIPVDLKNTPYKPRGATGAFAFMGQRCEGNTNCIPICPVQAKYNAMKTLADAEALGKSRAEKKFGGKGFATVKDDDIAKIFKVQTQSIASRVELDENNRISSIIYKRYAFPGVTQYELRRVRAKTYVLAGGAVENATLALASGLCQSSQELGRNLMDHPYMMAWGLAEHPIGPFRGPQSTAGIESFRDGKFRDQKAAFRLELGNTGWDFAAGAPYSNVSQLVEGENLFGPGLRRKLYDDVQRQVRIGILVEQLPKASNRVSIDPAYRDAMGEYRPVISYDVDDYSRAGLAMAHEICMTIFRRMGIRNHTSYDPSAAGYLTYDGNGYSVFGAGHLVGTHRMGTDRKTSVTDAGMRTHDHDNLWMVGCGSMPTIATSNPTLTLAALAFKAADAIEKALK